MKRISPKPRALPAKTPPVLPPGISRNARYLFDFPIGAKLTMYIFSAEMMQKFGVRGSRLVAVETVVKPTPDMVLVCSQGETFHTGRLIHDDLAGLCAIEKGAYDLVFLSDVEMLGEPVGYCPAEHESQTLKVSQNSGLSMIFTALALARNGDQNERASDFSDALSLSKK